MFKPIVIKYSWNVQIFWWQIWSQKLFLDISKAFDKAWYQRIIFKLRQNGISGDLLNILSYLLSNRKQRVVLNSQASSWAIINLGARQGFILGPLLFLIYINGLHDGLISIAKLLADKASLFSMVHDINTSAKELKEENKINNWAFQWKISFNPDPKNKSKKFYSVKNHKNCHMLSCFLTIQIFCKQIPKNILD